MLGAECGEMGPLRGLGNGGRGGGSRGGPCGAQSVCASVAAPERLRLDLGVRMGLAGGASPLRLGLGLGGGLLWGLGCI